MKVSFNVFNQPNSIQSVEEELDSFRTTMRSGIWAIARTKPGLDFYTASQLNYVNDKLGKIGVDDTKLVYYGIQFMLDRIMNGDIDIIANTQKKALPINTADMLTRFTAGSSWI